MKKSFQQVIHRVRASLRTPRGRDILTFVIFVSISAILWSVLSLNEEEQYDLRMPLKITHVPDSATIINPGPEALSVSVRGRGTQMFKFALGSNPSLNIDFRAYRSGNRTESSDTPVDRRDKRIGYLSGFHIHPLYHQSRSGHACRSRL